MDCHEFARSRFANSRNDEFLVILSFRKKAKYPLAKPHLWLFRKSQSLHYLLEIVLFYALIHQKQIRPYTKNFILYYPLNLGILLDYKLFVKNTFSTHLIFVYFHLNAF